MTLSHAQRRKMHVALDQVIDEGDVATTAYVPRSSWTGSPSRAEFDRLSEKVRQLEATVRDMKSDVQRDRFRRSQNRLMVGGLAATGAINAAILYWFD